MSDIAHLKINLNDSHRVGQEGYELFRSAINRLIKIEKLIRYCKNNEDFLATAHPGQKKMITKTYISLSMLIMLLAEKDDTICVLMDPIIVGPELHLVGSAWQKVVQFSEGVSTSYEMRDVQLGELHDFCMALRVLIKLIYRHVPFHRT